MIDIQKLIDIQYLLEPRPTYNFEFLIPFIMVFGLLLTTGIGLSIVGKWRSNSWSGPIAQWLRWFGFLGLLLTFFRYEGIAFVSMRLFYYFLLFGFLIWFGSIVRNVRGLKPKLAEQAIRRETYEKYLPQSKRKRA